jgi:two-component system KDP operon response regulator KdpE
MKSVLVVDDEATQRELLEAVLARYGYRAVTAASGGEAVHLACEESPDVVLLDVVMPDLDGWQTCRILREITDVPIIMMTGQRRGEEDLVRGLDCGADEYLHKPVGNRELLARIRAVLRRAERDAAPAPGKAPVYDDGYLTVDVAARHVDVDGRRVRLTPREFRLLAVLLENPDRVLTHRQVLETVWGFEYIDSVDYVRIYISHLRQKIEPDSSHPGYILTEPGVGYRFATRHA